MLSSAWLLPLFQMATSEMLFRMRRLQGDRDFPQTKQATVVDSLDINLACTARKIRPETFCYLLSAIISCVSLSLQGNARPSSPSCKFWRSRCPPWSQGCSARPPIAAGVWYKHLDGGLPVLVLGATGGAVWVWESQAGKIWTTSRF
jgi:hypothetical protein